MRLVPIVLAFCLAAMAGPAVAFNSVPFGGIHGTITRAALSESGLSPRVLDRLVDGNWRGDFDEMTLALWPGKAFFVPNQRYRPGHHFDRGGGEGHAVAFERGVAFVAGMRRESAAKLSSGQLDAGLLAMGRGLHALQDFCSHSNIIDLPPEAREVVLAILEGAAIAPPPGLMITGYDPETGRDPEGDPFGHDAFSKDGPDQTPEARLRMGSESKYEAAFAAAVERSRVFVQQVRQDAGEDAWRELRE